MSPGFAPVPRLYFALAAREVPLLAGAVRQLEEARPTLGAPRGPSLPRTLGALWLAETMSVDLVALPIDEAFAPLWALVLPGVAAVIKVRDEPASPILKACCDYAGVKLIDATSLVGSIELGSARSVASLLAASIHAAAS